MQLVYIYIYIYIYIQLISSHCPKTIGWIIHDYGWTIRLFRWHHHHHHYHVVLLSRISLTLSRHFSLSFIAPGRSSGLHPAPSHSCCMYVRAGRPAFSRLYVGIHRSTSLMSSPCFSSSVLHVWFVYLG